MTYRVVVTPGAERDLDDIFQFIARNDPGVARRFAAALRGQLAALKTLPTCCPRAPEDGLDGPAIRHLLHGRHRILFTMNGRTAVVLQVRHGARLPMGAQSMGSVPREVRRRGLTRTPAYP
ncbi:MAG: type II toxin-antitoxin system RelE/ParE family toxin [Alphaproteobacteria bacterium]|nr:type II toxin-antitoxin system RelE/ParE family toxin [Alphaproteobacteria bacterium]